MVLQQTELQVALRGQIVDGIDDLLPSSSELEIKTRTVSYISQWNFVDHRQDDGA
jgi:hypothetical protein